MEKEEELSYNKSKADTRTLINVTLLSICFILFTFIISINPDLLKQNIFLTSQLVCAIPLIMSAIFARSKLGYTPKVKKYDDLGFVSFLLGYAFLINVVGILVISLISFWVGLLFFSVNAISAISYSAVAVSYDKKAFKDRIVKDAAFILLLIFLGILPSI